jgi:intracellular sulfur oxidation DsrE/DsrF family protein
MAETQSNKNNTLIYIIIGVLLLGNVGLLYTSFNKSAENTTLTSEKEEQKVALLQARSDLDSLRGELDAKIAEVRKLGGDTTILSEMRRNLEGELAVAKRVNYGDSKKINELTDKVNFYMAQLQEKDAELAKLKSERDKFNKDNQNLKGQVSRSADSLNALNAAKQALTEKVSLAAILRADGIVVFVVDAKGREKEVYEGDKTKAKKIDQVGIEFVIADNKVARKENKDFFLRVVDASGATVSDPATGGGSFTLNGTETAYSAKQSVLFDNNKPKVEFRWKPVARLAKGIYNLEIYCEGSKIGESLLEVN